MASIPEIIAGVVPDLYYNFGGDLNNLKRFKELIRIKGISGAVKELKDEKKWKGSQAIRFSKKEGIDFSLDHTGTEAKHTLTYDSSSETLEPVYFYILDMMDNLGLKPEKLVDNFVSSPGSGHFAELGQRATIMQQQAGKILGDVNTVLRSVLNIIYDLKEFRIRLEYYNKLKSKNKSEADASKLALKQIWMDKVDISRGNSSIKGMAMQGGFQTLIDAFLAANSPEDVDKIDLNDRVKRILKPRVYEFAIWLQQSGDELKKRYELEKTYLRSQVNSMKLYAKWAKPYLLAAQQLEMKEPGRNPSLVKTFNTIILELTLLGKREVELESPDLKKEAKKKYYSCILMDFVFRGIPQRVAQQPHYLFGGKVDVSFSAYALTNDELAKLEEEMKKSEIEDVLGLIEGATTESMGQLQKDIDSFLEEKTEEEKKSESSDFSNPLWALIGKYNEHEEKKGKGEKGKEKKKSVVITSENFVEKTYLRPLAAEKAVDTVFNMFDIYKKAHGMVSYT